MSARDILKKLLSGEITMTEFDIWLDDEEVNSPDLFNASKSEFIIHFLEVVRSHAECVLQPNLKEIQTTKKKNIYIDEYGDVTFGNITSTQTNESGKLSPWKYDPLAISTESDNNVRALMSKMKAEIYATLRKKRMNALEKPVGTSTPFKRPEPEIPLSKLNCDDDATARTSHKITLHSPHEDSPRVIDIINSLGDASTSHRNNPSRLRLFSTPPPKSFLDGDGASSMRAKLFGDGIILQKRDPTNPRPKNRPIVFGDFISTAKPSKAQKNKKRLSNSFESDDSLTEKTLQNLSNQSTFPQKTLPDLSNRSMFPDIGSATKFKNAILKSDQALGRVPLSPRNTGTDDIPSSSNTEKDSNTAHNSHELNKTFSLPMSGTPDSSRIKSLNEISPGTLENTLSPNLPVETPIETPIEVDDWVAPDRNKVTSKEILNKFVHIYKSLSLLNLVPSITSDLYSLILILLSKQKREQLETITANLQDSNSHEDILKVIHNSAYFATRILWHHKKYLNFILEKNALNMLSECEVIGDFMPDLETYLTNLYIYHCLAEHTVNESGVSDNTHGIVCWNNETDNLANFPSTVSFQAFKKQRDMFYDIYRWYPGTGEQNAAVRGTSFYSRIRSLLATAVSPANHAHLATLFVAHLTSECMSKPSQAQMKMKKLQRRFTVASGGDNNHMLPRFGSREIFYKEFLTLAENELFRSHVKDVLISEIRRLDVSFVISTDDNQQEKGCIDVTNKFVKLTKTLRLLAKFLSYLSMLPYCQVPVDFAMKTGATAEYSVKHIQYTMPKEKIYERELAVRNQLHPSIDLTRMLMKSITKGRLAVTVPWIVQYLSITDYTGLRTDYSEYLIKELRKVFMVIITPDCEKNIDVRFYLITMLSWLFDLPHFPQNVFFSDLDAYCDVRPKEDKDSIDSMNLIHLTRVLELCPFLKRFQTLCTCPPGQGANLVGTVKHVKPITIAPNPEDMQKMKSLQLQISLEQELLKSQPLATQRVIEMVVERVTYCGVHDFREALASCIESSKLAAINLVNSNRTEEELLTLLKRMYQTQLAEVKTKCMDIMERSLKERTQPAIEGLISGGARDHLVIVAFRTIKSRLLKWLGEHLNSTDVLCKDIEGFMKKILRVGPNVPISREDDAKTNSGAEAPLQINSNLFDINNISPSTVIFDLKSLMCQLTSSEDISRELYTNLKLASAAIRDQNIMMRPPVKMTIFLLSLELSIMYITYLPDAVNEQLFEKIAEVWEICCPNRKQTSTSEEETAAQADLPDTPQREADLPETSRREADLPDTPQRKADLPDTPQRKADLPDTSQREPSPDSGNPVTSTASSSSVPDQSPNLLNKKYEQEMLNCFMRILCVRNIRILNDAAPNNKRTWEKLAELLVFLIRNEYLNENQLTDICVEILQTEWLQDCYDNISRCFRLVIQLCEKPISHQFVMYMEFLEGIAKDMDNFE